MKTQISASELAAYNAASDVWQAANDAVTLAANRRGMAQVPLEKLHRRLVRKYDLFLGDDTREADSFNLSTGAIVRGKAKGTVPEKKAKK